MEEVVDEGATRTLTERRRLGWAEVDDAALEAILTLRAIWSSRHEGYEWSLNSWGEGPSRVTLADLGLQISLRSWALVAVCIWHGRFQIEWSSGKDGQTPRHVRCIARQEGGERCAQSCVVWYREELTVR